MHVVETLGGPGNVPEANGRYFITGASKIYIGINRLYNHGIGIIRRTPQVSETRIHIITKARLKVKL